MPCRKRCGSATMLPFASRLTCQQSSTLMYSYPASFIPDFTIASAILRIMSSLTSHANLFQEFQPMGGVSARPADAGSLFWATSESAPRAMKMIRYRAFIGYLYQKGRDRTKRSSPWRTEDFDSSVLLMSTLV